MNALADLFETNPGILNSICYGDEVRSFLSGIVDKQNR